MSLFNRFAVSEEFETRGRWQAFDNVQVKIAHAGGANAKAYEKVRLKHFAEVQRAQELGLLEEEEAVKILAKVYAAEIVRDWRTKVSDEELAALDAPKDFRSGEDGQPIAPPPIPEHEKVKDGWRHAILDADGETWLACTPANVEKVLLALPMFFGHVRRYAENWEVFRKANRDALSGN